MAGITILQLACDGKPQLPTDGQNKVQNVESPQKIPTKMEPAVVSVSPQGKGVGVFGLEGSPGMTGDNTDGPLKDPKVSRLLVVTKACVHSLSAFIHLYNFSFSLCPQLLKSLKTCRAR